MCVLKVHGCGQLRYDSLLDAVLKWNGVLISFVFWMYFDIILTLPVTVPLHSKQLIQSQAKVQGCFAVVFEVVACDLSGSDALRLLPLKGRTTWEFRANHARSMDGIQAVERIDDAALLLTSCEVAETFRLCYFARTYYLVGRHRSRQHEKQQCV